VYDTTGKAKYDLEWENFTCDDGNAVTAPVGSYKPNSYGLHDMLGNVWEWVEDCYNKTYDGAPTDVRTWATGDCSRRVVRGGSWNGKPASVRSAERNSVRAHETRQQPGFPSRQDAAVTTAACP
jgi:formylglycine-generating enzyme required for sulfatase activity